MASPNKKTVINTCGLGRAELTPIQLYVFKKRSLNKRRELVSKYRHENRFYLYNFPPAVPRTGSPPLSDFAQFFQFSDVLVILQRSVLAVLLEIFDFFDFFRFFPAFSDFSNFLILSNFFRILSGFFRSRRSFRIFRMFRFSSAFSYL